MKNSIIFVSAFSVVSITMVSCASEPQTTTTAMHQATVTRGSSPTLTQAPGGIGYHDNKIGSGDWGGGTSKSGW